MTPEKTASMIQLPVFLVIAIALLSIWKMGSPERKGKDAGNSVLFSSLSEIVRSCDFAFQKAF
jgi:hypothetical protein